jgi:hypothetical protein
MEPLDSAPELDYVITIFFRSTVITLSVGRFWVFYPEPALDLDVLARRELKTAAADWGFRGLGVWGWGSGLCAGRG